MGKAGGREMMAGSDLDLMLIYDHPAEVTRKPWRAAPAGQPVVRPRRARLCRGGDRAGRGGPLYEVDMRLRPSGNKGPVAVSLGAFRRYHAESGVDVGANGVDAGPRGRRSAGAARTRSRRR